MFHSKNCNLFSPLLANGLNLCYKVLFSISKCMFLVKSHTKGHKAKCMDESCSAIFASCFGVT